MAAGAYSGWGQKSATPRLATPESTPRGGHPCPKGPTRGPSHKPAIGPASRRPALPGPWRRHGQ
eukprot:7692581-Lingulodinium_polyedra.AAC.1